MAGASDTTLTLSGSGFTSSTTVALNGVAEATNYVSATQVKATIPAAQLATAATLALTATNGGGSGPSAAATFTVNNPAPAVTSLSTQSITAGSTSPTITITGAGFVGSSSVFVNGTSRTTTFISGTQLSFMPTAEDIALPGTLVITVSNAAPGGGTSAAVNITVAAGSPTITSTSPNSILAGSANTTITITGTNFFSTSVAMIGTTALPTTYVSNTQLTTVIPADSIASLNWLPLTVHTPSASSTSATVAIPVAVTVPLNANHIVYDPYNRKLWATIGTTTSTLAGNSLVSIDPATGTIGTPVTLSSAPYAIALSDSGKTLYALTSTSVIRYDMTTSTVSNASVPGLNGGAVLIETESFSIAPGMENELVMGTSSSGSTSIQVYDYDPPTNTVTARPGSAGIASHYGFCPVFLNSDYLINPYNSLAEIDLYPVTSTGLESSSATYTSPSEESGCMKIAGNVGYSTTDNVYAFTPTSITKSATINLSPTSVLALSGTPVAPDLSLHQVFFGTVYGGNGPESLTSASTDTNLLNSIVTLPTSSLTPSGHFYYSDDLFRWGQDGLALLLRDEFGTGGAILYLLRGPFVVPQELNTNTAASITAVSSSTITAGSGNTLLTLFGANFVPGVAVTWNGSYRTTTIVDPTHVTVAIPASDLTAAGTGTLVATNPGASASSSLTIEVQ
jgi:trimeric autotransporter adhesin